MTRSLDTCRRLEPVAQWHLPEAKHSWTRDIQVIQVRGRRPQRGGSWPAFKPVFKPVGKGLRGLCFWKWLGQKLVSNQFDFTELVSNQFVKMVWQRTSGIVLLKVICPKTVFKPKKLVPKQFLNWFQTSFWNQVGKGLRGLCFWKWFGKTDPNWLRTSLQTAWHLLLSIISAHQIPSSIIRCCGSFKVVFKLQYSAQYLTGVKSSHTCRCDDVAEMRRGTLSLIAASRPNAPPRRNINPVSVALFDW